MDIVSGQLRWDRALVYVDDVNIYSPDFDTHMAYLQRVFDRLKEAGLKLRAKKCKLGMQ